jgi:putative addiction module component (TIGR02574 family)
MAPMLKSLNINQLSVAQRILLVEEIWESIAEDGAEAPPSLSESQLQELRRRVAEDDADPDNLIPWEEVKAQALKRVTP